MAEVNLKVIDPSQLSEKEKKKLTEELKGMGRKRENFVKGKLMVMAEKKGEVVGYMNLIPQKNTVYIENTKVKKEERRKGIASKMNEVAENVAKELKKGEIYGQAYSKKGKEFWKSRKYRSAKMGAGEEVAKEVPVKPGEVTSLMANEVIEKGKKKKKKRRR